MKSTPAPASVPIGKSTTVQRELTDVRALGEVLRAQRKHSGLTLKEAAGLCGVGVRFLLELEHGKRTASVGKALQVAQRMGLKLFIASRGREPWR